MSLDPETAHMLNFKAMKKLTLQGSGTLQYIEVATKFISINCILPLTLAPFFHILALLSL